MKYEELLEKALPYYKRGRVGDVEHIKWLATTVPQFIGPELDKDILMAVVLLHDVGYSEVPKDSNPFDLDIRKLHSEKGAEIAEKVLRGSDFPQEKIAEVKRLILKHDNWAFGDSFADEPILRLFSNFDFTWMASEKGFDIVRGFLKMEPKEFYEQIRKYERKNEEEGRTWYNEEVKDFYEKLMIDRITAGKD